MSRLQFVAVLTFGCVVSIGRSVAAGDTPPSAPAAEPATESTADPFTRIRQLIQAGEHLEAAGALDLAREARAQAESLLAEEAARLACEQGQLEELSRDLVPTQIMVQALVVEARDLPADLLARVIDQRGGELIRPDSATDGPPSAALLAAGRTSSEEIGSLAEAVHINVLSRPQVMALDGTPAQIQIGQRVPVVTGFTISDSGGAVPTHTTDEAGISLMITPTTVADGGIRLELKLEQSRFSESNVPLYTDPQSGEVITSPVKDITTVQTSFTLPEGRTLFFPAFDVAADDNARETLLVLLRPQVVTNCK